SEVMSLSRFLFALVGGVLVLAPAQASEKTVTVTGEATVGVAPDTAIIRIGVSSQEKTAREAGEANAKQMTLVLSRQGVLPSAIFRLRGCHCSHNTIRTKAEPLA